MRSKLVLLVLSATLALVVAPAATSGPTPHMFDELIRDISALAVDNPDFNPQPLLASAEASAAAFMRGNDCAAFGALGALSNKLEARFVDNPDYLDDPNIRNIQGDIAEITDAFIDDPNASNCIEPEHLAG